MRIILTVILLVITLAPTTAQENNIYSAEGKALIVNALKKITYGIQDTLAYRKSACDRTTDARRPLCLAEYNDVLAHRRAQEARLRLILSLIDLGPSHKDQILDKQMIGAYNGLDKETNTQWEKVWKNFPSAYTVSR